MEVVVMEVVVMVVVVVVLSDGVARSRESRLTGVRSTICSALDECSAHHEPDEMERCRCVRVGATAATKLRWSAMMMG